MSQTKRKDNTLKKSLIVITKAAKAGNSSGNKKFLTVSAPVARSLKFQSTSPQIQTIMSNSSDAPIRIKHREYITDIVGHNIYTINGYKINPGFAVVFPWLSNLARNYERYSFDSLNFIYEPYVSTSTNGSVMMAVDYDGEDPPPANKTTLMSYQGSCRTPVWSSMTNSSTRKNLKDFSKERYIRHSISGLPDSRLLDVGTFLIATDNSSVEMSIGELYVEYDVTLMTPQWTFSPTDESGFARSFPTTWAAPFVGIASAAAGAVKVHSDTGLDLVFNKVGQYLATMMIMGNSMGGSFVSGFAPVSSTTEGYATVISSTIVAIGTAISVVVMFNINSPLAAFSLVGSFLGTPADIAIRIASYATTAIGEGKDCVMVDASKIGRIVTQYPPVESSSSSHGKSCETKSMSDSSSNSSSSSTSSSSQISLGGASMAKRSVQELDALRTHFLSKNPGGKIKLRGIEGTTVHQFYLADGTLYDAFVEIDDDEPFM